jgi:hypothetical protein
LSPDLCLLASLCFSDLMLGISLFLEPDGVRKRLVDLIRALRPSLFFLVATNPESPSASKIV